MPCEHRHRIPCQWLPWERGQRDAAFSAAFQQKARAAFVESVGANGFPGGVLGFMRPEDDATFLAATGMAEALSIVNTDQRLWTAKTSMTADTRFRIASVTKPFTATMILMLVDQGALSLDQTIEDFFPGLVPNSSIITLRNLLNMTSGLYDHEEYPPMVEYITCGDLIQHFTPEELIELSNTWGKGRVLFAPGEYFRYVNTNFTILAMIAKQATDKTYKELITSMIIDRLELDRKFRSWLEEHGVKIIEFNSLDQLKTYLL